MNSVDFENISDEDYSKLLEKQYLGNYSSLPMSGSQRRLHFGIGVSGFDPIFGVPEEPQEQSQSAAYGADSELISDSIKDSIIPFDLLRKVSAHNIDMWAEYAISTKGWHKIRFSQGLQAKVDSFFKNNPDKDPLAPKSDLSIEEVLQLDDPSYYYFLNSNLIPTLLEKAAQSPQAAADWISQHGFSVLPRPRPRPPS